MFKQAKKEQGQVILIAVVIVALLLTFSAIIVGYTTLEVRAGKQSYYQAKALQLADAGLDKAIYELNQNTNYPGETGTSLADGEVTIAVSNAGLNYKQIRSTAYVPNSTDPFATKTVVANVAINTSIVSFNIGVQVGQGGLTMANNSQVTGNIYSNGNVTGGNGRITQDVVVAAGTAAIPDQQWTTQNSDFLFANTTARADAAQSFTTTTSGSLNYVSMYLKKIGNPGNLSVQIVRDEAGSPSKTVVGTGTLDAIKVTSVYDFIDVSFSTLVNLSAGQKYWIILDSNANASNYYIWGLDNSDAYASQTGKYSASWNVKNPVWNNAGGDFNFKAFLGGVPTYLDGVIIGGTARAHSMSNCTITGNAFYATDNTCVVAGNLYPNSEDQPPQALPISNAQIAAWRTGAAAGGITTGPYTVNGTVSMGPQEINGDLTVNGTLNLTGTVWVKGDIHLSVGSNITVDSSLGNSGAVLMADDPDDIPNKGKIQVLNNVNITGNGTEGSFVLILSTNSSDFAIDLNNNANGPIFYAANGGINIWNNVDATQLVGYSIHLNNNATITYATGIPSAAFFNGPGGSWAFLPGTYSILR